MGEVVLNLDKGFGLAFSFAGLMIGIAMKSGVAGMNLYEIVNAGVLRDFANIKGRVQVRR